MERKQFIFFEPNDSQCCHLLIIMQQKNDFLSFHASLIVQLHNVTLEVAQLRFVALGNRTRDASGGGR